MEKEQKKLLLVAVSVGVFLLITITAAAVLLRPKANIDASYPQPLQTMQPVTDTPQIIIPDPLLETVNSTEREVVTIAEPQTTARTDVRIGSDQLVISIPQPTAAAIPDIQDVPRQSADASRQIVTVTPAKTTASPAPKPAAAPASTATTVSATRSTAAPKPAQTAPVKTINDYWVQTGAFTAMVRAEDAKETLATKGITSIIENRLIDGRIWYRVRLGPYTSENEANYWLTLVKAIDGFEESQVRQTVRQN